MASFEALSDAELHAAARRLTARSNVALADLLAHLGEVERRGIHRERACSSLYTYCVYELRMSEDVAFRRAKAARLVHQHPELRGVVARGELHLTGLLMIAPYLGGERHAEVLERARFRTKREIARLLAEIDPEPAVPARVVPIAPEAARAATHRAFVEALAGPLRSLPEGGRPEDWISPAESGDIAAAESAIEGAEQVRQAAPIDRPMSYEVRFTASQEYVDLLDEGLGLLGGPHDAARLPELQLRALRELVARMRKRKTGQSAAPVRETRSGETESTAPARDTHSDEPTREARSTAPARDGESGNGEARRAAPARETHADVPTREAQGDASRGGEALRTAPARSDSPSASPDAPRTPGRYIPAAVRRAVWDRDGSRCAYTDERGRRCLETCRLEVHHLRPYALGGPATVDNLALRCRAHNELAAEQDFGRAHMGLVRKRGAHEDGDDERGADLAVP